ncbi:hypothetical protein Tco_1574026, partial [Tanacetum coccineum]
QDSLNSAARGNFLDKRPRDCLCIIESKSKVHHSRSKVVVSKVSNVSRMNTISRESVSKTDERIDKLADQLSTLVEIVSKKVVTPAPVKAVEEICVTCSGPHAWYNCPNTNNNQASICAATGTYNQVNPPNRVGNQMAPPGFALVQNNGQNRIHLSSRRSKLQSRKCQLPTSDGCKPNSTSRGNNFNQGQIYQPQINQPPTFQALPYQAPAPTPPAPGVSKSDFDNYVKANDAVMQNMQNQMANITDLITKFMNSNTASTSGSGSIPSNTIANPKGDVKAITTRSGVSYNGPQISS